MYDVRNTRTLNLGKSAELSKALIPDFGLNKMFQTNSHHHCHLPGGSRGSPDLGHPEQDHLWL